jgi:hypothetical protein
MAHEYSKHQQDIIRNYYDNRSTIMLQKLGELVTELYLADTDAKRDRLWQRVEKSMAQLKVAPTIAANIMQKRDCRILAENLKDWLARGTAGKAPQ